jgi:hypothetical protein
MNNKGQGQLLFVFMFAFVLFIIGMVTVNFIKDEVTRSRGENFCTSPLTDGGKVTCLLIDGVVPYFFVLIFSGVGGLILEKFLI